MLKLHEEKELTENSAIRIAKLPDKVCIPLSQHLGKMCQPIAKVGDIVKTGQLIATLEEKAVYAPVHSSISGKVTLIDDFPHPVLGRSKAIVIASDGSPQEAGFKLVDPGSLKQLTPHDIRRIIFDCGIVGMGGAGFPTHIKLNSPKRLDSFILNGAECEPYLTGDSRLMLEKTREILLGIELVRKCTGVNKVFIAIEENKPDAIKAFKEGMRDTGYELRVLKPRYPQGGEKQLIKAVLKREVPSGKLPFDVGAIVHNVATVYAIYEALYFKKSLYERVITVAGDCLENPGNLLVRIGTSIKDIMLECGPVKKEPQRIVFGGPMMGLAQYSLDTPVIKNTNGIIFLSEKEIKPAEEALCVRCSRCVAKCPLGLMPCMIAMAVEKEKWDLAKAYGLLDCMECGSCSYVCPQRRNIVQSIKYAKARIPK